MASGVSLHAVDVASGRPAAGMAVELVALTPEPHVVAQGLLGPGGALDHPVVQGQGISTGSHEARFHVGDWMRAQGLAQGSVFMEVAVFRFVVASLQEHYHLPMKFTAWGYALFRGS